jgi:flagellar biosynthesis regulator FlbT
VFGLLEDACRDPVQVDTPRRSLSFSVPVLAVSPPSGDSQLTVGCRRSTKDLTRTYRKVCIHLADIQYFDIHVLKFIIYACSISVLPCLAVVGNDLKMWEKK